MLNPSRGLGFNVRRAPIKPRKCRVCKKVIANPQSAKQKVHDGACKREWTRLLAVKFKRKRKAAALAKKERKRVGDIKGTKPARDRAFLDWVREQYCLIGELRGSESCSNPAISEAAHVGDRGMRQKCPDRQAIPLCAKHHRTAPDAHHRLGKRFFQHHGLDRATVIADYNARYEAERAA